ncbi:MAG: ParB/RepB/Spo0J family partition protein [Deltaproteobacteria bacterium]|nr:ParB/RepB/Spo0J family partition protein [Deltaproteobacteria bacterium]
MSAKERKALGRGFGALLKAVEDPDHAGGKDQIKQVAIDDISSNPKQPREFFDEVKLEELSQSIRSKGVIQPILVRRVDNGPTSYELIAGERRLMASKLAGFDNIPVIVKDIKDRDLLEIALIENIQREELNPIEESLAYKNLIEEHGFKQEDLAKRVGKNRSTIANMLRLLQLPESIKNDLRNNVISAGHARTLLSIDDQEKQIHLRNQIVENNFSVRDTEEAVRREHKPPVKPKKQADKALEEQMLLNENRLQEILATNVTIKSNGQKGKIELSYTSHDDFNRLFSMLVNLKKLLI